MATTSSDAREFSRVVSLIYDAALDPALWTRAIEEFCAYVNVMGAMMGAWDLLNAHTNLSYGWGYDPHYAALLPRYWANDPLSQVSFQMKAGEVLLLADRASLETFYKTDTYREWARPQGIIDSAQICIDRGPMTIAVIGMARQERHGLGDETLRRRLHLFAPHFRRALAVGKTIDLTRHEAAALADTIDQLSAGVFIVDADRHPLHVNRAGQAMLDAGTHLRLAEGELEAHPAGANRALREAFAAAVKGGTAMQGSGVAVPLGDKADSYLGHVLPLSPEVGREVAGRAVAALFVSKATTDLPAPVTALARRYGLTASESRVLLAIAQFGAVRPAAGLLSVSEATVKTHLRHIFAKTGAQNQSDLVRLAVGHAGP